MRKPRASGFEGPSAPYADAFAEQLDEEGYGRGLFKTSFMS